jgi:hypothetical protein
MEQIVEQTAEKTIEKTHNASAEQDAQALVIERAQIRAFQRTMKCHVLTTRFNAKTWAENETYRRTKLGGKGCAYGVPKPIAMTIPIGTDTFVLEMNNDLNRIMGVGKTHNCISRRNGSIHSRGNYNLYIYAGKQRVDRSEMTEEEDRVMRALDILCFRGSTHIKRGQGMITFPLKFQFRCLKIVNFAEFFATMFRRVQIDYLKEQVKIQVNERDI